MVFTLRLVQVKRIHLAISNAEGHVDMFTVLGVQETGITRV